MSVSPDKKDKSVVRKRNFVSIKSKDNLLLSKIKETEEDNVVGQYKGRIT